MMEQAPPHRMSSCHKPKVAFVSAFERGFFAASELAKRGFEVTWLDLGHALGTQSVEEEEGPFGFSLSAFSGLGASFVSEGRSENDTQTLEKVRERLFQQPVHKQSQGVVISTSRGPICFRDAFLKDRLRAVGIDGEILTAIERGSFSVNRPKGSEGSGESSILQSGWLYSLAQQMISNVFLAPCEALEKGAPLWPLSSSKQALGESGDFNFREVTRVNKIRSLEWLARQGVRVLSNFDLIDVSREGWVLKSLLLQKIGQVTPELLPFDRLVWCLTSEETFYSSPKLFERVYDREKILQAEYSWLRLAFKANEGSCEVQALPSHQVMIRDFEMPVFGLNFLVVQKQAGFFNVWLRVRTEARFQKTIMDDIEGRILSFFREEWPCSQFSRAEDIYFSKPTYHEVGPPRFPIYSPEALRNWKQPKLKNFIAFNPEAWKGYGYNYLIQEEVQLVDAMEFWLSHEWSQLKI
jgi:hypothetical protein